MKRLIYSNEVVVLCHFYFYYYFYIIYISREFNNLMYIKTFTCHDFFTSWSSVVRTCYYNSISPTQVHAASITETGRDMMCIVAEQ